MNIANIPYIANIGKITNIVVPFYASVRGATKTATYCIILLLVFTCQCISHDTVVPLYTSVRVSTRTATYCMILLLFYIQASKASKAYNASTTSKASNAYQTSKHPRQLKHPRQPMHLRHPSVQGIWGIQRHTRHTNNKPGWQR